MEEHEITPSELAANLLNDSQKITNAVLIYKKNDNHFIWYVVGDDSWSLGAMEKLRSHLMEVFLDQEIEDEEDLEEDES